MGSHTGITKILPAKDYHSLWVRMNPEKATQYRKKYHEKHKERDNKKRRQQYYNQYPNATPHCLKRPNLTYELLKKYDLGIYQITKLFGIDKKEASRLLKRLGEKYHISEINGKYHLYQNGDCKIYGRV